MIVKALGMYSERILGNFYNKFIAHIHVRSRDEDIELCSLEEFERCAPEELRTRAHTGINSVNQDVLLEAAAFNCDVQAQGMK